MNGILIIDKPLRMSSAQAVAAVKRRVGDKRVKVGHAGTLDPLATGVLVIAIGPATKCIDQLMATTKRYRTHIDLSAFTTTDDVEGPRTEIAPARVPSKNEIRVTLASSFTGRIMQRPPAFSAVKVSGRRAYSLARSGGQPDIASREVVVHELVLVRFDWPIVELDIHCGKGFYVRSLARDLGQSLGTGGHCASIRRTAVGPFRVEDAMTIEALPETLAPSHLIAPNDALKQIHETAG